MLTLRALTGPDFVADRSFDLKGLCSVSTVTATTSGPKGALVGLRGGLEEGWIEGQLVGSKPSLG